MAKIKFHKSIESIKGKVGGMVYSDWKNGVHTVKAKSVPRAPKSEAQFNSRLAHRAFSSAWKRLPYEKRELWYSEEITDRLAARTNSETGNRCVILIKNSRPSGHNALMSVNHLARSVGQTKVIDIPRLDRPVPHIPTGLKAVYRPGHGPKWDDGKLVIKCDKVRYAKPGQMVRFWAFAETEVFHRQIVGILPAASPEKGIVVTRIRSGGGTEFDISFFGNNGVFVQADVVDRVSGWGSCPCPTIWVFMGIPNPKPALRNGR